MTNNNYNGMIIDGHCHISSSYFIPPEFYKGLALNIQVKLRATGIEKSLSTILDMFEKGNKDHMGDRLIKEMDSSGIDMSVLLLPDFSYVMDTQLSIAEMFSCHYDILKKHPDRFFVFAGVDPRWGSDGIDLFEKGVKEYGFKGLKLYPPCGYSPSDESLFPYYEICRQHNLPVLLHIGPTSPTLEFKFSSPKMIDKAAFNFPDVNFILAHGGVNEIMDTVLMCAYRPNVYTDISAFLGSLDPNGWVTALQSLFKQNINHKIIFGTDWPVFQQTGGHKKVIDKFTGNNGPLVNVSKNQQSWLMHKNISRLLNLP